MSISAKINFVSAVLVLLLSSSVSFGQDICPGADVEVATQSFSYSPATLVVDAGTTVGWVNFGGTHDVNGIASYITGDLSQTKNKNYSTTNFFSTDPSS